MNEFPKPCSMCSAVHDAASWAKLRLLGQMEDEVERLEFRQCSCSTTLAVQVPRPEPDSYCVACAKPADDCACPADTTLVLAGGSR